MQKKRESRKDEEEMPFTTCQMLSDTLIHLERFIFFFGGLSFRKGSNRPLRMCTRVKNNRKLKAQKIPSSSFVGDLKVAWCDKKRQRRKAVSDL